MSEDRELRGWLGLGPGERLVDGVQVPRPPSDVAEGRAEPEVGSDLQALLDAVRARPDLSPPGAPASGPLPARLRFWDPEPAVVVAELGAVARARGEAAALGEGAWLLDGRRGPAWLAFEREGGTVVLRVDADGARFLRVEPAVAGDASRTAPAADLPRATPAELLGDEQAQPWLLAETERLWCSPGALDRFVAVGLLARLWSPPAGPARRAALARRLRGEDGPHARVASWARAELRVSGRAPEDAALVEAAGCREALETLARAAASAEPSALRERLHALAIRRDDLESVALVLRVAGRGEALARALAALDDTAATHASALSWMGLDADERLREVAWQEPLAWWGALAAC